MFLSKEIHQFKVSQHNNQGDIFHINHGEADLSSDDVTKTLLKMPQVVFFDRKAGFFINKLEFLALSTHFDQDRDLSQTDICDEES